MIVRNRTLDGLRGYLAVLVLTDHALLISGSNALLWPSQAAVWTFFVLSACVLTRVWDGRFPTFLARRFLRLWPTYAICLAAGEILLGAGPDWWQFIWLPAHGLVPAADWSAWSLTIEVAAMFAMPLIVWVGRGSGARLTIGLLVTLLAQFLTPYAFYAAFFLIGSWVSRWDVRWAPLERRLPQWLGRISYPLYLCHLPIMRFLGLPLWASIPLAFAVAALLTETVERWAISASRFIPDLNKLTILRT